jgi:hypothetical protein
MGGGSSSMSNVNNVTSSVTNAMAQAIMNCSGNTMTEQKFVLSGSYNAISNFKMVQAMSLSATCANSAENLASVQSAVTAAVTAAANAQAVAGIGSLTKSSSSTNINIHNDVTQNITSQTLTNVINTVNAVQSAVISGDNNIVSNFSEEQTLTIIQNACQSVISKMDSVQQIASSADAAATSTQTDPIASLFTGIAGVIDAGFSGATGMMWVYALVFIAIIIAGCVMVYLIGPQNILKMIPGFSLARGRRHRRRKRKQDSQTQPDQQAQQAKQDSQVKQAKPKASKPKASKFEAPDTPTPPEEPHSNPPTPRKIKRTLTPGHTASPSIAVNGE